MTRIKQLLVVGNACLSELTATQFLKDLDTATKAGGFSELYFVGRPFEEHMPVNRIQSFLQRMQADKYLVGYNHAQWMKDLPEWFGVYETCYVERWGRRFFLCEDDQSPFDEDAVQLYANKAGQDDLPNSVCIDQHEWPTGTYGPGMLLGVYPLGVYASQLALDDYVAG